MIENLIYLIKLQARERELQLLQEEKRKCDDLERQLNEEKHLREKIAEENIKLRDKKKTQVYILNDKINKDVMHNLKLSIKQTKRLDH